LFDRAQDRFQNSLRVPNHVVVPEPQNEITHRFQRRGSLVISLSVLVMLSTIDFDDELPVSTEEIDDILADRSLSFEFPTGELAIA
jgi:hypothetical protein